MQGKYKTVMFLTLLIFCVGSVCATDPDPTDPIIKKLAEDNATANKTSYEDELDSLLGSKGLKEKTLKAYEQQCLEKEMEDKFYDNFYKYCRDELSSGIVKDGMEDLKKYWTGYFTEAAPYHVSHILVKLGDSTESNYSDGKITEQDAKNLYGIRYDYMYPTPKVLIVVPVPLNENIDELRRSCPGIERFLDSLYKVTPLILLLIAIRLKHLKS